MCATGSVYPIVLALSSIYEKLHNKLLRLFNIPTKVAYVELPQGREFESLEIRWEYQETDGLYKAYATEDQHRLEASYFNW